MKKLFVALAALGVLLVAAAPAGAQAAEAPSPSPSIIAPFGPPQGPVPVDVELQSAGPSSHVGLWLARFLNYLAMTVVVGLLTAGLVLFDPNSSERKLALRYAGRAAGIWALSSAALFVFGLAVASALPVVDALKGDLPGKFAGTRLGRGAVVQAVMALAVSGLAFAAARRSRRGPALIGAVLVTAVALFLPAFWGHAGTSEQTLIAVLSDWAHLAAVTVWVGGLVMLAVFVLKPGAGIEPSGPAQRFSKLAGISVFVVLLTGTINALMRIGTVDELISTEWGKLVVVKLVLFAVIAFLGYKNRNRMLPGLKKDPEAGKARFRKMAVLEVGIMLLSFATATALASSIPSDAEAASRIQSVVTAFGPGQINLTVEPAQTGDNLMHLYFLDATGKQLEVTDPSLSLVVPGTTLDARLFDSGPGHYTVLSQQIDRPGTYNVVVTATVNGGRHSAGGSVTIRD